MKKKDAKKPKSKLYHVAYYVENGSPAMRRFESLEDMNTFFKEFEERYPKEDKYSGSYLDFCITDISGKIKFL